MRDDIATARTGEVRALTEALDPARYVVDMRRDRVAVRTIGRGTRYFYSLSKLREFCEAHRSAAAPPAAPATEDNEVDRLRRRVAELETELMRLSAERSALQARARQTGQRGNDDDERFVRAKRAFAKLFHPDRGASASETLTKADVFRSFWGELERIEKG